MLFQPEHWLLAENQMPTFDGVVKTKTRVSLDGDAFRPDMGTLVGSKITEQAGIHGDRKHTVDGTFTELTKIDLKTTILGNCDLNVGVNQTIEVGSDQTETVAGTSNETVVGPHIITNMNVFNETRLGTHIQAHGGLEWVHDNEEQFHYGGFNFTFYSITMEFEVDHFEAALGHNEFKGQHNYFSINDNTASLILFQMDALNAEAMATQASVNALKGDIQALQARAGGLEGNAHACVATAGPDPNITPLI